MKSFLFSHPFEKSIRVILLVVILFLNFGSYGTGIAYAAPPSHDDFNSAKVINTIEYHDVNVNTTEATPSDTVPNVDDPDNFVCEGETFHYGFASVWYKYTPPQTQSIAVNTIGSNDDYDTFIAVWTGSKGNLTMVPGSCNDDTVSLQSETSFIGNAGTTYYIEVAQFNDGQGTTDIIGGNLVFNAYIANTEVRIKGEVQGRYYLPDAGSLRRSFIDVNNGPVRIHNLSGDQIMAAERVVYKVNGVGASFTEMMGLPQSQLSTIYWLPWYNNVELDTQLRFGNVSSSPATVQVFIGGAQMPGGPITLGPGESTRKSYPGISDGPVQIVSTQNIVAAERVVYKVNGVGTSFTEMMGLPQSQLSTIYWLPWYNNVELDTQLRFGNVSGAPASVRVYIGGVEMPGGPITLGPGESTRKSYPGINDGPVQIVSTQNIVAAERVVYKVNGVGTSFAEMMGLPNSQLNTTYWIPSYNNVELDTQLRFANVSGSPATVHVYIAGQEMDGSPFTLEPSASTRKSFVGVNNGPVRIESDVNIVAAERVVYKVNGLGTSFSEMMGLPNSMLDISYWMPWYNNFELDTQLRFGKP
jgi:hypothetical protein